MYALNTTRQSFFTYYNFSKLAQEEKDEIREELRSSTFKVSNIDAMEFYKVPFQKVTDLIKSRRVYVSGGIAYIPQSDLMSLFVTYFRKNICDIGIPVSSIFFTDFLVIIRPII